MRNREYIHSYEKQSSPSTADPSIPVVSTLKKRWYSQL
jgi:hypothetical protein